jgi:solute carrier family 32 (vesicular inhibitory amino acid transporter)
MEILLGLGHPGDVKMGTKGHGHQSSWGQILLRIFLTMSAVAVSMVFPQFSAVMAFMGSFSAFLINVVGPVAAKVVMQGRCGILDGTVIVTGVVMTIWGTYAAFSSA